MPGRIDSNLISHHTIQIRKPAASNLNYTLNDISEQIRNGMYEQAKQQLLKLDLTDEFVRKFLLECIIQTQDHESALAYFHNPQNEGEAVAVINAAIQTGDRITIQAVLKSVRGLKATDPLVKEQIKKMEAILQ